MRDTIKHLRFSDPVAYVYNPLEYAWEAHSMYVEKYGASRKKVIFLGMNPGLWGMVQTGVPFGEIAMVRDWLGIAAPVGKPPREHPRRPVEGFACKRSEVSGRRLWGLFAERFHSADAFFADHFVANYCPLVFLEEKGTNRTPDKLRKEECKQLFAACDRHLNRMVEFLGADWIVGVGKFAEKQARNALANHPSVRIGSILHPSPASPAANRGWAAAAERQLEELQIWAPRPR